MSSISQKPIQDSIKNITIQSQSDAQSNVEVRAKSLFSKFCSIVGGSCCSSCSSRPRSVAKVTVLTPETSLVEDETPEQEHKKSDSCLEQELPSVKRLELEELRLDDPEDAGFAENYALPTEGPYRIRQKSLITFSKLFDRVYEKLPDLTTILPTDLPAPFNSYMHSNKFTAQQQVLIAKIENENYRCKTALWYLESAVSILNKANWMV